MNAPHADGPGSPVAVKISATHGSVTVIVTTPDGTRGEASFAPGVARNMAFTLFQCADLADGQMPKFPIELPG